MRAKAEGALPFMVSATAGKNQSSFKVAVNPVNLNSISLIGTTVLGAFDPLEKIADLCEKYNLWMHVDAAWGGNKHFS